MVVLDYKSSKPIYEQIIEQVKYSVMKGYLKSGDAIPSVRKLALDLSITPGTVAKAYQELERQHIIETIRGKGTFIAQEIHIQVDEHKVEEIEKKIKVELMELRMMGYTRQQVIDMIQELYEEMEL